MEIAIICIALGVLGGGWALVQTFNRRESRLKSALESAQKQVDAQTSKLNILMRALPNVQALLASTRTMEGWKVIFLDEARALIHAEMAGFWRLTDRDQSCELDTIRGPEIQRSKECVRVSLDGSDLAECLQKRLTSIGENGDLLAPLIVEGNIWGAFRFGARPGDPYQRQEVDLMSLFVRQLSQSLENQSLLANREKFYLELMQALADLLDARDSSHEGITRQARVLSRGIAKEMGLPDEFIYYLEFAALMHDIGNIAIDDQLLKKPGKLTPQEFELVKKHPEYGYKILAPVTTLAPVAPMVLYHQEWFNGKGYPDGLAGEEIPLGARIVAVLDAWGAMTSHRPWRRALSRADAINEIKKGAGTQFDPKVVDAFIAVLRKQNPSAQ